MREIKFRAMTISDVSAPNGRRFVRGLLVEINHPAEGIAIMEVGGGERWQVDMNTVGQYTGFKDERGREIYEGDIVAFEDGENTEGGFMEHECAGVVEWDESTGSFYVTNRLYCESYEVLGGGCVVIGNVYEDKDKLDI